MRFWQPKKCIWMRLLFLFVFLSFSSSSFLPLPLPPALERSLGGVRDLLRISLLCWGCFSAVHIVLCIEFLRCCAHICAALERTQVVVLTCCFAGFVAAHRVGAAADNICATGKDPKVVALTCCFAGFIAAHRACAAVHNICAALEREPKWCSLLALLEKTPGGVPLLVACWLLLLCVEFPLLCTTYALRWEGPQVVFLTCFAGRDPCRWCSLLVVLLAEWCSLLVALASFVAVQRVPAAVRICALLCKGPQAVFLLVVLLGFVAAHRDCAAVHT